MSGTDVEQTQQQQTQQQQAQKPGHGKTVSAGRSIQP